MSCNRASLLRGAEGTRQIVHYAGRLLQLTDLQVSVVVLAQQLQEAQDVLHDAEAGWGVASPPCPSESEHTQEYEWWSV